MSSVEELAKAKQYLRDLTCGGLLLTESRTFAETLLQPLPEADWKRLFTDENILKKNSPHTAIRYAKAIRQRLQPLGIEFNHAVVNASDSDYKQLLMLAFIIHKPVMVAFMQSVVAETKRVYKPNLAADAWDSFIHERARTLPGLNKLSVPVLYIKALQKEQIAKHEQQRVGVVVVRQPIKLVNNIDKIGFIQTDAVGDSFIARQLTVYIVDSENKLVSSREALNFDSTSKVMDERTREAYIKLVGAVFDRHASYTLILEESDTQTRYQQYAVTIDLAFKDDFF